MFRRYATFAVLISLLVAIVAGGTVFALSRGGSNPGSLSGSLSASQQQQANPAQTFAVGDGPNHILSAGTDIWVANFNAGTVTKLNASDGTPLGTFPFGNISGLAFDGVTLWISSLITGVVTRVRPSDGFVFGSTVVGTGPQYIAIDSEGGVWVSNSLSDDVTKVSPAGIALGTFAVGNEPAGILFDGANIWVANSLDDTVTKLRPADGAVLGTFSVGPPGSAPVGLAFDGTDIWVANSGADNVTRIKTDGALRDAFPFPTAPDGQAPLRMAFDGANMWVVNNTTNNVTKLRASDGFNLGTFDVGTAPLGIAFDGANIWVTNQADDTVTKRSTITALGPNLVSQTVNFQGLLKNAAGNPINGVIPVVDFRIYDHATDGPALWGETQSVTAEDGVFSVQLGSVSPFDADLFEGKELWLAVKVGADPEMLPRLQISSVAMALVAGSSATAAGLDCTGCVTATELAAGAVTTTKLANDSVDSTKIADGAVTTTGLANDSVDSTTIADGAITATELANDSVGSTAIADGAVAPTDVSFNYAGSTGKGGKANDAETLDGLGSTAFALAGIPVTCGLSTKILCRITRSLKGLVSTIAIRPQVADCNQHCTVFIRITTIDSAGDVGQYSSIAMNRFTSDPIISYYDLTNKDLKVAKCDNDSCTLSTVTTVDSFGSVGQGSAIAVGYDGLPIIAYSGSSTLKVTHCESSKCDGATTITVLDQSLRPTFGGAPPSIAIGPEGLPVISYFEQDNRDVKVAACLDIACTSSSNTVVDGPGYIEGRASIPIAIGADRLPIIAYYATIDKVNVAHCAFSGCQIP